MIRKYIWPLISPFFNDKRLEPYLVVLGAILVIYGLGYTIWGVFAAQ